MNCAASGARRASAPPFVQFPAGAGLDQKVVDIGADAVDGKCEYQDDALDDALHIALDLEGVHSAFDGRQEDGGDRGGEDAPLAADERRAAQHDRRDMDVHLERTGTFRRILIL